MNYTIECHACGKENQTNRKDQRYCNRKCYLKIHKEKTSYKKCAGCDKQFKVNTQNIKNKYCEESCRRLYAQIHVAKKHDVLAVTIDNKLYVKECKICNKLFELNKQKADRTICSKECISEFYRTNEDRKIKISRAITGDKHHNYIKGKNRDKIRDRLSMEDKKYIFKLFKNKCFKCGNGCNLAVDHHIANIRGAKLSINNAVILCKSCNSSKNAKKPEEFYSKNQLSKLKKMGIYKDSLFNVITNDDFVRKRRTNNRLKQSDFIMRIIKDSDYGKNLQGSVRFAIFECASCKNQEHISVQKAKRSHDGLCVDCAKTKRLLYNEEKRLNRKCKNGCDSKCVYGYNFCEKCSYDRNIKYQKKYRDSIKV